MFGNGKHLSKNEIEKLDVINQEAIDQILKYAQNFIPDIPDKPIEEKGFIYDVAHPLFNEKTRYKGFIGMGTTYFQKYNDYLLIEINVTHIPNRETEVRMINGYLIFNNENKKVSQKLEVLDEGNLVVNVTGKPEVDEFIIPSDEFINNPNYVPGEELIGEDQSLQWAPLCINTCCRFRKYGNPFGTRVDYEHCGPNCGSFHKKGGDTPVNDLDYCCASHDACWREFDEWDCECDRILVSCARRTNNAGSSRVANFFAGVVALNC